METLKTKNRVTSNLLFGFPNFWRLALLTRNYLPKWPSGQDIKIGIDWVFFLHAKVIVV
jgi:hypothetical protein